MHEGHHGILDDLKKQGKQGNKGHDHAHGEHDHDHGDHHHDHGDHHHDHGDHHHDHGDHHHDHGEHAHPHPHPHGHHHPHEKDAVACESCESPAKARPHSDLWMKLIAGGIVAALVVGFLVWRFM